MKTIGTHNYHVYILTNLKKTVLYTGVTNDLGRRLFEHSEDSLALKKHFTGKYNCIHLIYYERYDQVVHAIEREKEIKGWSREKKEKLISDFNPEWGFLNHHFDEMD
jgi:putative endonuclease